MRTKILTLFLILLAVCYSAAPVWVDSGASLNYSVGTDSVSFTVINRTAANIALQIVTKSTGGKAIHTESAIADSGEFWFDTSLLSMATVGSTVDAYTVMSESTQTFAGTSWDAITLQGTVSGAVTTDVYDKSTGLLLKQTVAVSGAPVVTLTADYLPGVSPAPSAPSPPANNNTPAPPANPNPPAGNTTPSSPQDNGSVQPNNPQAPSNGSS